jgi:hypothetical protein
MELPEDSLSDQIGLAGKIGLASACLAIQLGARINQ